MPVEKNLWSSPVPQSLFQDRYGILALAAHATLTKTPIASKITHYFRLQWTQWTNRVLVIIKQLLSHNPISFSDFVWIEPDVLMYHTFWEEHMQKERKSDG